MAQSFSPVKFKSFIYLLNAQYLCIVQKSNGAKVFLRPRFLWPVRFWQSKPVSCVYFQRYVCVCVCVCMCVYACMRVYVSPQSFFSLRPMEAYCVDCFASHSYPSCLVCLRDSSMLINKELAFFFLMHGFSLYG